ncbi:MAG: radical SAM protein [Bacilli bacterium]
MKWSIFIYKLCKGNKTLLYNTLNHAIVIFDNNKLQKVSQKLPNADNSKIIKDLKSMEFLIDENVNEEEMFLSSLLNEWNDCGFLGLHILTTTACNFKCPYCYQSGISPSLLDNEKIKKVIDYIEKYVVKNKIKESNIEITGGEPTTNWDNVEFFLNSIDKIFKKNKIKYKIFIVTNGFNFNKEKVDLIAKFNWCRAQITLDGPEKIHNNRRMLRNGDGTYKEIINNLKYILNNNKIDKINLRINYDNSNILYIPGFLKYIKKEFGTDKIIISLGLITKTVNCSEANKYIDQYGILEDEFLNNYIKLYKTAYKLGFHMSDIFSFDGMCTAKLKHSMVIEPNGNIVKCVSGVGREEFKVGNIFNGDVKDSNYLFIDKYKECLEKKCEFLPLCHTGCRFESMIKYNNFKKVNCKKDLLNKINAEILKINYF